MISFKCDNCSTALKVADDKAGKTGKCPACNFVLIVPQSPWPEVIDFQDPLATDTPPAAPAQPAPAPDDKQCTSCGKSYPARATVCTDCGIYMKTGRPILSTRGYDEDNLVLRTEKIIRPLSWLLPIGVYPIYSEAIGKTRPYATWAIAAITVIVSVWFWIYSPTDVAAMHAKNNLMLWSGDAGQLKPLQDLIEHNPQPDSPADSPAGTSVKTPAPREITPEQLSAVAELQDYLNSAGEFHAYQLVTYAFLHADIMHLAGNLLFLLVFATRVNEVIGNIATVFLYPILGALAAWAHMLSQAAHIPSPMLGASGAIMGMAGLYLILFPAHRVYMVAWFRWGLFVGFKLSHKIFATRGFIVVLCYVALDVAMTILSSKTGDGVAHWAHIGGMIGGVSLAAVLLTSRLAYSRCDMLSMILGKYAWPIIGTPAKRR